MAQRDRQRRYRARQQSGETVYRVLADDRLLLALIESGRLTDEASNCRERVEDEMAAVLREWAARWTGK